MAKPIPEPPPVAPVTDAEHRRALRKARRPDGTVDPWIYGAAIARPLNLDGPPPPRPEEIEARKPRVKKAG